MSSGSDNVNAMGEFFSTIASSNYFNSTTLESLEDSKLAAGIASILIFFSAKYLVEDVQQCFSSRFNTIYFRCISLFSLVFLNTRSIKISFLVTCIYYVLKDFLADWLNRNNNIKSCAPSQVA